MNEVDQKLIEDIQLGSDAKQFQLSNIGQHLSKQAIRDEITALRKLAVVDPNNKEEIHKLQLEAAVPRRAMSWIEQAIATGKASKDEYELRMAE